MFQHNSRDGALPSNSLRSSRTYLAMALGLGMSLSITATAFERDHDAHEHGHATLTVVQQGDEVQMMLLSPAMNIVGFEHMPASTEDREKVAEAGASLKAADRLFTLNKQAQCVLKEVKVTSELLADAESTHSRHDKHHDKHHGKDHQKHAKHDRSDMHHDKHHVDHHDEHHGKHGHHDKHHDDQHDEHHGKHGHHDKHHDDHHDKHHDEHDHHDEHPAGHTAEHGVHSEFEAAYHYACAQPSALTELNIAVFEAFPGMQTLDVQLALPTGQRLQTLQPGQTRVAL